MESLDRTSSSARAGTVQKGENFWVTGTDIVISLGDQGFLLCCLSRHNSRILVPSYSVLYHRTVLSARVSWAQRRAAEPLVRRENQIHPPTHTHSGRSATDQPGYSCTVVHTVPLLGSWRDWGSSRQHSKVQSAAVCCSWIPWLPTR